MSQVEQFPFTEVDATLGAASGLPLLPITLKLGGLEETLGGLVDSGAMVNVLPYDLGVKLGAVGEQQTTALRLAGTLASAETRGIVLTARVGQFPPVRMVFAWTRSNDTRLLLGQTNFFMEFDVCVFRSRSLFEVRPKEQSQNPPRLADGPEQRGKGS